MQTTLLRQVSDPFETPPPGDEGPWFSRPYVADGIFHAAYEEVYVPDVGRLIEVVRVGDGWAGLFRLRAPNGKRMWLTADVAVEPDHETDMSRVVVAHVREHLTREHLARQYLARQHQGMP